MDNKGKKMLALGVVAVLCAVAVIGVGYAAFAGNARTYNEGNSTSSGYMTLSPNGVDYAAKWQAITHNASSDFDTYTCADPDETDTITTYFFTSGANGSAISGKIVKAIGTKTLTFTNKTGGNIATATFGITASALMGDSNYAYYATLTSTKFTAASYVTFDATGSPAEKTFTLTFDVNSGEEGNQPLANDGVVDDVTLTLYIGYTPDVYIPDSFIGKAVSTPTVGYSPAISTAPTTSVALNDVDFTMRMTV